MADRQDDQSDQTPTTPTRFPETTPPNYPLMDFSFTVQGIFELKGSVSKLEQSVLHLKESVDDQKKDIRAVQRTLWIATGAFLVISAAAGFLGNKVWDTMMRVTDFLNHPPAAAAVPAVPTPSPTLVPTHGPRHPKSN